MAVTFALIVLAAGLFSNIDVFDLPSVVVPGIEPNEMGEIVVAFLLVLPALVVDHIIARQRAHEANAHETKLMAEQLRVLQVTVRTVQDIVNNNLNQLQLLRFEAEGHVSADTVALFDGALQDTAAQLKALGNMAVFAEKPMAVGLGLDISTNGHRGS